MSVLRAGRLGRARRRRAPRLVVDGLRPPEPDADVSAILADVRARGDAALRELTRRLDGADLADPWVDRRRAGRGDRRARARGGAARKPHRAIGRYHAEQRNALRAERRVRTGPGVTAWRRWQPIERAGGYVPGGRAAYASSVLMLAVPARLAGVGELIVATPPDRDGSVPAAVLVAARIGGVDRVLKAGGAQAIAALAYGTASVPAVDKIFGAGNAWVTAAKRAVGAHGGDRPAGRPVRVRRARRSPTPMPSSSPSTCSPRPSTAPTRSPSSSATTPRCSTPSTPRWTAAAAALATGERATRHPARATARPCWSTTSPPGSRP